MDFVLRSGLNVTVTRDAQWRPLAEHTVTAFTDALNRSPLNAALMRLALGGAPAGGMNPFHRQGLNRSRLASLAGTDILAIPQLRVMHIVTERPVPDVLDTTGLGAIPDAGESRGVHLLADPALDLADDQDGSEQVRRWLIQLTPRPPA